MEADIGFDMIYCEVGGEWVYDRNGRMGGVILVTSCLQDCSACGTVVSKRAL